MPFLSTAQYNELPLNERAMYDTMMQRANNYASEPTLPEGDPRRTRPYMGDRMADIPQEIRDVNQAINRDFGAENGMFHRSENAIRDGMKPFHENYQAYMNPYQQAVIRQLSEEGSRNFNENIMPGLDARFLRLGQFGSTKHADLGLRAARDFQRELLNKQQQALSSGYEKSADIYNNHQSRNLESANQLSNLATTKQGSRYADINALEGVGRYNQQQNQSILDAQYQEYLRQQDEPMRRLQAQSAILNGMPHTLSTTQFIESAPIGPQTSVPNQIGNIAQTLLALRLGSAGR
jgi:hypothetical protein